VVATTPRIPGLEVHVPPGVVLQTADGPLTRITLTRMPVDRPPFPVPAGATFLFTPQTHSARVQRPDGTPSPTGVRFILPNFDGLAPGTRLDLWTYNTRNEWYSYGQGTVSADGTQIVPDPGVEFHTVTCAHILAADVNIANPPVDGLRLGDPVDVATGLFVYEKTDLGVQDVIPITVSRHYRQGDRSPLKSHRGLFPREWKQRELAVVECEMVRDNLSYLIGVAHVNDQNWAACLSAARDISRACILIAGDPNAQILWAESGEALCRGLKVAGDVVIDYGTLIPIIANERRTIVTFGIDPRGDFVNARLFLEDSLRSAYLSTLRILRTRMSG
jgi:hypothetical protein